MRSVDAGPHIGDRAVSDEHLAALECSDARIHGDDGPAIDQIGAPFRCLDHESFPVLPRNGAVRGAA